MITRDSDFQFFTFFLGLRHRELEYFDKLIASFPFSQTHPIHVVDQSPQVQEWARSGSKRFQTTWHSYLDNATCDASPAEIEACFTRHASVIRRLPSPRRMFHGEAIDWVLQNHLSARFAVIMDTDIEFISDRYLDDVRQFCSRHDENDLAAIGQIVQEAPFHLTLNRHIDSAFYKLFMPDLTPDINWKAVLAHVSTQANRKTDAPPVTATAGRFPRLHPALLTVNGPLFLKHGMSFHNLYLAVLDCRDPAPVPHRLLGDNGASFLFQCALADKQIVNVPLNRYAIHHEGASRIDTAATEIIDTPAPRHHSGGTTDTEALFVAFLKSHVRDKWKTLGQQFPRIYLFGGGAHTTWLLDQIKDLPGPAVAAILDDHAAPDSRISGFPVIRPEQADLCSADAVMISSDSIADKLANRVHEVFGTRLPVIRLYESLPLGPYPKGNQTVAPPRILTVAGVSRAQKPLIGLYVDPVGGCNLYCAMCPRGWNDAKMHAPKGLMSMAMFHRLMDKVNNDRYPLEDLTFGNWGEPLLHPELPRMIRLARTKLGNKITIEINTNLNVLKDPTGLLAAGVNRINISASGMSQNTYSRNHRGGNLRKLLRHIIQLATLRDHSGFGRVKLVLRFHKYLYNMGELPLARAFAARYGLRFKEIHPFVMPVEECIRIQNADIPERYSGYIDPDEERRRMMPLGAGHCYLLDQACVDFDGTLTRCCGVFDRQYALGSVFDFNLCQVAKIRSSICVACAQAPMAFRYVLPGTESGGPGQEKGLAS